MKPSYIKYIDKDIDILVCSYGGVGTTMLINFLSQYKKCNDCWDRDRLKHTDHPSVSRNKNLRVIYVVGSPLDTVVSVFRRGIQENHSRKLLINHKDIRPLGPNMTLSEYAIQGTDRFRFEDHFNNWRHKYYQHTVMFVKYEKLWDNLPTIFTFLGVQKEEVARFPAKRKKVFLLSRFTRYHNRWSNKNVWKIRRATASLS